MQNNPVHILSTRPVSDAIVSHAAAKNIVVDALSFIETEAIDDPATLNKIDTIAQRPCVAIFTSMNAAEMVIGHLKDTRPDWVICCMGNSTKQIITSHFAEKQVAFTANDAVQLAKRLIAWRYAAGNQSPVVFFCGDQRRDELPVILRENKILLHEVVTYKTVQHHHVLNRHYDAVLFFSPSAVYSFFTTNQLHEEAICFAIGDTTARAIRQYDIKQIITGSTPSKDQLLEEAITYFSNRAAN